MKDLKIAWSCDFCGKMGLVIDLDGEVYCKYCRKGYGKDLLNRTILKNRLKRNKDENN